ncbi:MAG: phage tail protein [Gemmatimonadota bacterium]
MSSKLAFNAPLSAATGAPGKRNDPYLGASFLVEIEGLVVGGFSEVTGLQVETEVEDYREGGENGFVHRLPGPTRYPSNLVLRRGITDVDTLWAWHQEVTRGNVVRRNGTIYLLDAQRTPALYWNFTGAYPVRWSGPDFRAEAGAVAVESVELVHKGIGRPAAGPEGPRGRAAADVLGRVFG